MERDSAQVVAGSKQGYPITKLQDRSLIGINEHGEFKMHDLVRDMGRGIVAQQGEPRQRSRLRNLGDLLDSLAYMIDSVDSLFGKQINAMAPFACGGEALGVVVRGEDIVAAGFAGGAGETEEIGERRETSNTGGVEFISCFTAP
ncbi:hypothetical protein EJ110_NYTH29984 [Nymphaea thermarum]|nr:hypothetical protein EJ110_NYTH29984 [Nymphaea thermarum]